MEYGLVALWAAVYLLLAAATTPIARVAFRRFPPASVAALAFPLSALALFLPIFWVGHLAFGTGVVFACLLGVLAVAVLLARRRETVNRAAFAEAAAVFLAAFAFLIAIRAVDPAAFPGGGEKFLDFGLLQTILRDDVLPPESMWFAGEPVNYYYGGHLLAASLAKLTATPGRFAYNLALAGFYATVVVSVYGLSAAVADGRGVSTRTAGLAGAFLFGFAANLFTPFRLVMDALPASVSSWVGAHSNLKWDSVTTTVDGFSYWDASRVIPGTINEFPLFAFLNGDLHGHMLSPIGMAVVVAAALAYYRAPRRERARRLGLLGLAAAAAGSVTAMNTWSLPTALGVVGVAATFAPAPVWSLLPERAAGFLDGLPRAAREVLRPVSAVALAALVGAAALAAVAPFVATVLLEPGVERSVEFLPERSGVVALVLVHGGFLAVFARYLSDRVRSRASVAVAAVFCALLLAFGAAVDLAGVAVFAPLLLGGWYLLRRGRAGFETVLVVAGAGLLLLVEFIHLNDGAGPGRMNTVFKTYAQAWFLWSIAGGATLAAVAGRFPNVHVDGSGVLSPSPQTRRQLRALGVSLLLCTLSVYGVLALNGHFAAEDSATLDATDFVERYHAEEAEAISWLSERQGKPHIASAPGEAIYQWSSPAASLTGLPTIAGWSHAADYQGREAYRRRVGDTELLYTGSAATRAAMLRKYDVEYVYYGPAEKERYGSIAIQEEPGIQVAHRSGNVTVYGVNRSALG